MEGTQQVFARLVGRVLGALDLAKADETLKQTIKAYIWQAQKDLKGGKENDGREKRN